MPKLSYLILKGVWASYHPDDPFPVGIDYIRKLMNSVIQEMSASDRRALSIKFAMFIREEQILADVSSILRLLGSDTSNETQLFASRFFDACRLLSRGMAFLVPPALATMMAGMKSVSNEGVIEDGYDDRQPGETCMAGTVYRSRTEDALMDSKYMQCVKLHVRETSAEQFRRIQRCMLNASLHNDGRLAMPQRVTQNILGNSGTATGAPPSEFGQRSTAARRRVIPTLPRVG